MSRENPRDRDAELAVLGALIVRPEQFVEVCDEVSAQDFGVPELGWVFESIAAVWQRQEDIDLVSVQSELAKRQQLSKVGGPAFLSRLIDGVPRSMHGPTYARIVREHATRRRLMALSKKLEHEAASAAEPPDELIERAEEALRSITTGGSSLKTIIDGPEIASRTLARINQVHETKGICGVETGFEQLDAMTGGLQAGDLIVVAARPSMGKSALISQVAWYGAWTLKRPVLWFSLEMDVESVATRMACSIARVDSARARSGLLGQQELDRIMHALNQVHESALQLDTLSRVTPSDVRRKARQLRAAKGDLALVVIDYLGLLEIPAGRKNDTREREIANTTRGLKALAKEVSAPVLLVAQLNRECESRGDKRPMLSDLRESGALEQDADVVLFPFREAYYTKNEEDAHKAELHLAKQRNGPTGTLMLNWDQRYTRFDEVDRWHQDEA